jgi:hypothetical protein
MRHASFSPNPVGGTADIYVVPATTDGLANGPAVLVAEINDPQQRPGTRAPMAKRARFSPPARGNWRRRLWTHSPAERPVVGTGESGTQSIRPPLSSRRACQATARRCSSHRAGREAWEGRICISRPVRRAVTSLTHVVQDQGASLGPTDLDERGNPTSLTFGIFRVQPGGATSTQVSNFGFPAHPVCSDDGEGDDD